MSTQPSAFDAEYYRKFYEDPRTRAVSPEEVARQMAFVCAYLQHLDVPIRHVLDLGCGMGLMRDALARNLPGAHYHGVDHSHYVCERFGWEQASVVDYAPSRSFDLVICHDVIQYLGNREADQALNNLARLSDQALLLAVLTREDREQGSCDPARTDTAVHLRSTRWYRQRLRRNFVNVGGGLFLKNDRAPVLWSLEHLD